LSNVTEQRLVRSVLATMERALERIVQFERPLHLIA